MLKVSFSSAFSFQGALTPRERSLNNDGEVRVWMEGDRNIFGNNDLAFRSCMNNDWSENDNIVRLVI